MGMPVHHRKYTVDDLDAMPDDGNRYEIIDGELFVTPPPLMLHQRVQMAFIAELISFVPSIGAELFAAPIAVRASRDTQVGPDLIAVPLLSDADESMCYIPMARLLLAIDVLSPSTTKVDLALKRRLYRRERVNEYWTVDVRRRLVLVWTPGRQSPRVEDTTLVWYPQREGSPLMINLMILFDRVHA